MDFRSVQSSRTGLCQTHQVANLRPWLLKYGSQRQPWQRQCQRRAVVSLASGAAGGDVGKSSSSIGNRIETRGELPANSPAIDGQYLGEAAPSASQAHVSLGTGRAREPPLRSESASPIPFVPAKFGGLAAAGGVLLLGGTFLIALFRTYQKFANPKAVRSRTMNKNKFVVESLDGYLPYRRTELTPRVLKSLAFKTGFKPVEIFRKYLWYLLRERKFDHSAVDDVIYLKGALGLSESEVAEAIRERAQRVYNKYGNVMLNTAGMTQAGIERKATSRALFSKLLFLSESERLLTPSSEAATKADIREVFGATEEDVDRLRIVSLYEVDLDKLEGQFDGEEEH